MTNFSAQEIQRESNSKHYKGAEYSKNNQSFKKDQYYNQKDKEAHDKDLVISQT